jgi:hypothetical protein
VRIRFRPYHLRPEYISYLLEKRLVLYDRDNDHALWFDTVLTFVGSQKSCFQVMWDNFLRGNLPLPNERIMSAWCGSSTHLSYIFKRHEVWKKDIVVGDGRGNFWLNVPQDVIDHLESAIPVLKYGRVIRDNLPDSDRQSQA